jgi:hypothetical protein
MNCTSEQLIKRLLLSLPFLEGSHAIMHVVASSLNTAFFDWIFEIERNGSHYRWWSCATFKKKERHSNQKAWRAEIFYFYTSCHSILVVKPHASRQQIYRHANSRVVWSRCILSSFFHASDLVICCRYRFPFNSPFMLSEHFAKWSTKNVMHELQSRLERYLDSCLENKDGMTHEASLFWDRIRS